MKRRLNLAEGLILFKIPIVMSINYGLLTEFSYGLSQKFQAEAPATVCLSSTVQQQLSLQVNDWSICDGAWGSHLTLKH